MHDLKRVLLKARRQAGVVSRLQLLKMRFSSAAVGRAVADGVLHSMLPGVYCVSTAADPVQSRLWAAALWGAPEAYLSHLTAAWWVWKLDGLGRNPPALIDVSIPEARRLRPQPGVQVHRVSKLEPGRDTTVHNGLPCTTLERTLVDLAAVLEPRLLEQAVDSAMRRNRAAGEAALVMLDELGRNGRAGAGKLAALAPEQPLGPSGSPLEVEVRQAIAAAGLPRPMRQLAVTDEDQEQVAVVDFAWPERKLLLFVHSRKWHSTPRAIEHDFNQTSDLSALGYTVLSITTRRFRASPDRLIAQLRTLLLAH
jgi:hypothetical protein